MIDRWWSLAWFSLLCSFWRLWLSYASRQMMSMRQESWVVGLHFDCHYKCTMQILNQVKLQRCWAYWDIISCSYILFCMYPLCCPLPLCIHGNSCLLGSTTGNLQVWTDLALIIFIVGTYINLCHLLTNESGDSSCIVSLLEWGSSCEVTSLLTLIGWMTIPVVVLNIHVSDSVYNDRFWLLSIWYLEPYWYFTAQQSYNVNRLCFLLISVLS
jgi:hypothetical protein